MLSLGDTDRVWRKAQIGVPCTELPRATAPESYAIVAEQGWLEVADLRFDSRFARHPLVSQAPQARFFACTVVHDAKGLPVGCLSVAHTRPHALHDVQRQGLRDLAVLASTALHNRMRGLALAEMSKTDPLTGLNNRGQFQHGLEVEMAHAMRRGEPFTVLSMDLDGFKDVVDGFGHAAGDEVLREVARRISQQVRLGDVLARLGEDEFGLVMRHGGQDAAQVLARRIVAAVSAPITLGSGDEIGVGISIGMAAYSDQVDSVQTLLAQADQALFDAKKHNERRWKMFVGIR
jgi:diguanylate cyclase (GGDEF)-like protein